jgi:hypothetical protein
LRSRARGNQYAKSNLLYLPVHGLQSLRFGLSASVYIYHLLGPTQALPSPLASSLLKALTRGRQWHEWIVAGEVSGQRAIAQKLGLNERYVGRVLECAFLAPDIVEAILDGRQPPDLTLSAVERECRSP